MDRISEKIVQAENCLKISQQSGENTNKILIEITPAKLNNILIFNSLE